ncbi:hypothetical protein N431DRAFT_558327 [Stipitochalara longipes BDJ]|nr:hypothetical protein N431DRAFT_558327 [Stipitochalara longipes BDJ]
MCFGTTHVCRVCANIEYSIIPEEHCGESYLFPSWHHVTGYTDRNWTCDQCLLREERALVEESQRIARQHESKLAMKEFMHGERQTHLTDQEVFQRSRDVLMAYSRGERLHPFAQQHIASARRAIEDAMANLSNIQIWAAILNRFDDMVERQEEIDATGRAITDEDRINSYDAIQHQPIQEIGATPPQPAHRTSAPRGFNSFVRTYYEEHTRPAEENAGLAPEAFLVEDVQNYIGFLDRSTGFGRQDFDRFTQLVFNTRTEDMRNFDFVPAGNPDRLVPTFREWLNTQLRLLALIQEEQDASIDAWLEALRGYGDYLQDALAPEPAAAHLNAFIVARQQIADTERRLYDEFRPSRDLRSRESGSRPNETEIIAEHLSFQDWVRSEWAYATTQRSPIILTALDEDLDGYDRYLRRRGAVLRLIAFRKLRSSVTDSIFEFTPAHPGAPSLLNWLTETNERRRRRGQAELSGMPAFLGYVANVLRRTNAPQEVLSDWDVVLTHYAEENRREMYGNARGSYSRVVEALRAARNTGRDLVYASLEFWRPSQTNPVFNPVFHATRRIRPFLRRSITIEEEPSPEQWQRVREILVQAQTLLREEEERRQEEWIIEMARAAIPRTPQTIDEAASTVTDSPPQRQQRYHLPPGSPQYGPDDDFPFNPESQSTDFE